MTKFFNKIKTPYFWPFLVKFPNFCSKNIFLENPVLSRTTSYGFLAPGQNLEKTNIQFHEKPGRMERLSEEQTDTIL